MWGGGIPGKQRRSSGECSTTCSDAHARRDEEQPAAVVVKRPLKIPPGAPTARPPLHDATCSLAAVVEGMTGSGGSGRRREGEGGDPQKAVEKERCRLVALPGSGVWCLVSAVTLPPPSPLPSTSLDLDDDLFLGLFSALGAYITPLTPLTPPGTSPPTSKRPGLDSSGYFPATTARIRARSDRPQTGRDRERDRLRQPGQHR